VTQAGSGSPSAWYQLGISTIDATGHEDHSRSVRIAVLGALEIDEGRTALSPRDQIALEALAALHGETLSQESLAEAIWGERPPTSWPKVVQGCVVRLRKALGASAVTTTSAGYRLTLHRDELDHLRFEDLLVRAREQLAAGEAERARYTSDQALALWRGEPFDRLGDWGPGRVESERLGERHRDAEELYTEAAIRAGRADDVLGNLHRMVARSPTRERRWGLLALAQYQLGRQADALGTIQKARSMLTTELGLDPGPELLDLERLILHQDPSLVAESSPHLPMTASPYPGLLAYDVGDSATYFGREKDVAACLRRISDTGVLAVVGPSGCGKSSLVRAGVAAALERDGSRVAVVTPGRDLDDVLEQAPRGKNTILVVDQCEEALALPETSPERMAFFDGLVEFAGRGQLVLSLRADRLGELSAHPDFAHLVEGGLYLLGAMNEDELRAAIEGPGRQAGLHLEPGLVDLLVSEVRGQPAALPLLSHVLRQTWRRREGNMLTVAAYAATGGVQRAVAQSAEQLYGDLTKAQQTMVRELMVRLVSSDDLGEPVPARVPRQSVSSDAEHAVVVERLVGARLLTTDGATVEIAHESLARAWPRLRSWLDDDVDGLRIMRHLTVTAASWDALGRPDSELYRGTRQAKAAEWHGRAQASLTETEHDFLHESAVLAEKEERKAQAQVRRERRLNQRLRAGLAAVAVLLAVAIVAGALATSAADRADQQSLVADARRLGAEALRARHMDLALLLAVAGTQLDDSSDTRNNLSAVLDRAPELMGTAKVASPNTVSVRPDGRTVAVGGTFTGVTIFDTSTYDEVTRNHDVPFRSVRFNPDGTQLAASVNVFMLSGERRVDPIPLRILDPVTTQLVDTQPGGMPPRRVVHESFAFSNNGRWLAAGFIHPTQKDEDTSFRVWDTRELARPTAAFTLPFIVGTVAISDDGGRVHVTSSGLVQTVDVASGKVDASAPSPQGGLVLSPDGSTLAVNRGTQVALLDPDTLTVRSVIDEAGTVDAVSFSPRGEKLGYAVADTLVVSSVNDPAGVGVRLDGALPEGAEFDVEFSADGRTVWSTRDDRLLAWDVVGDRRFMRSVAARPPPASTEIVSPVVSPDGQTVANLVMDGGREAFGVQLLDVTSGTRTPQPVMRASNAYYADLVWRPDGAVVASAQNDQWVDLWDGVTGQAAGRHRVPDRYGVVDTVRFSGNNTRLVVGTHLGWVYAVDASTLEVLGRPVQVKADVPTYGLAANGDGARALVWIDRRLQLLDLTEGRVLTTADPGFYAESWAWTPDGRAIVVVGSDPSQNASGMVAFLDPSDLSMTSPRSGPQVSGGTWIQFSTDGQRFATSGSDRVSLWDVAARDVLGTVGVEWGSLAGFAPGTSDVLIASLDGSIAVWDPDPEAAVDAACRIAGRDLTEQEWHTYLPQREQEPVCPVEQSR
jgi:DNA-binding SARP family transcriptional activator/WD40 repeat protein/energy-coupling factor transporter ATP-binding protein EcfA2